MLVVVVSAFQLLGEGAGQGVGAAGIPGAVATHLHFDVVAPALVIPGEEVEARPCNTRDERSAWSLGPYFLLDYCD